MRIIGDLGGGRGTSVMIGSAARPANKPSYCDCGNLAIQPKLTPEEIRSCRLLRELNERDRQVLGGMPRPTAADGLQALGYIAVHSPNSQDLLFTITPAGRAALA